MKLNNISGFANINQYVNHKLQNFEKQSKTFATLFEFMFSESENVMAETSNGYKITKVTYGECKNQILRIVPNLKNALSDLQKGDHVGIYMENSLDWIKIFWSTLYCGFVPLLLNSRLSDTTLEGIFTEHNVKAVISDGKQFSIKTVLSSTVTGQLADEVVAPDWADEIIFMSSGTTERIKLCVYTGENFFYQICDSVSIVKNCPQIANHYQGELKQLVLLPLYHVFGFIAVYLWFGFFSRTFVFLKDLNPQTVLNTIKKHKVTHMFAVPMVWETVHKEALRKIKARGEKTYNKFCSALKLANKLGGFGNVFAKKAFKEVRENLFGDSVQFLISGGSEISTQTLSFFNGIGYHMANGYGMTEVGIVAVECSNSKKLLNGAFIGHPFEQTQFTINEEGVLNVKGKTMASAIICDGVRVDTDFDKWFITKDIAKNVNGHYLINGRVDDLIISSDGENLNPVITETLLKESGHKELCVFNGGDNKAVCLVSIAGNFTASGIKELNEKINALIQKHNLASFIKTVVYTTDKLLSSDDFKVNRKKISKRYQNGEFNLITLDNLNQKEEEFLGDTEKQVIAIISEILNKPVDEIYLSANFFTDLGGSSLDYFMLADKIKNAYDVDITGANGKSLLTVKEICGFIIKN